MSVLSSADLPQANPFDCTHWSEQLVSMRRWFLVGVRTLNSGTQPGHPSDRRGPGAGAEVTAGGVFSDLLRLAAYLGAPS